jgi:PAS domain-containing protein
MSSSASISRRRSTSPACPRRDPLGGTHGGSSTEQVAHINFRDPTAASSRSRSALSRSSTPRAFRGHPRLDTRHQRAARLERELRESEERYRYLVASSPDLVWLTDAKGP